MTGYIQKTGFIALICALGLNAYASPQDTAVSSYEL